MLKINSMIEAFDGISKKALNNPFFLFCFILITITGFYASQFLSLDLFLANTGSSALHWLHLASENTKSSLDWPTGTRNLHKSLPMHIYSYFFNHTQIDLTKIIKIYIFIEILTLSITYFIFFNCISIKKNHTLAIIFVLVICFTSYQFMSLARFSSNFYWGLYYPLADVFRLFGLIFVLKKRPWIATTSFSIALMIHPVMSLIAIFSGVAVILYQGLNSIRSYLIPTITLLIPVSSWFYFVYSGTTFNGGLIPGDYWLFFTKLFNSHWYPLFTGVFDSPLALHILPTYSIIMLYIIILCATKIRKNIIGETHVLIFTLGALTLLGILTSFFDNKLLIKISAHRASSLMVVIALIPIIIKLWDDIFNAKIFFRCIAIFLLFSPFLNQSLPGFFLFFALLYSVNLIVEMKKNSSNQKLIIAFISWILGLILLIYSSAPLFVITKHTYNGIILIIFMSILLLISKYLLSDVIKNYKYLIKLIFLVLMSFSVIKMNIDRTNHLHSERSVAYYETQIWAKNNTKMDALFMLDPNIYGGWRDISQRASFGTVKEWLHNAWLYDSDVNLFIEGMRRAKLFNINFSKITGRDLTNIDDKRYILKSIKEQIRKTFYTSDKSFYKRMTLEENIDYFVFENKYLLETPDGLEAVYVNEYFSIYK